MKLALMSINPEFAFKILFEQKKFEYRKVHLSEDVSHIVIYATAPIKKIIGIASVKQVLRGSPHNVWETTKKEGGVVRRFYREYFKGKKYAFAIELDEVVPFNDWINPNELFHGFVAPQSFKYVSDSYLGKLLEYGKKKKVIFVGGMHGVGKSTMCDKLKIDIGVDVLTASKLIKNTKSEIETKNKIVKSIKDNQIILLQQLKSYTKKSSFLLDGHFTLLNKKKEIEKISINVFRQMNLSTVILINEKKETIMERLQKRDSKTYNIDLIELMRKEEIEHAKNVANELQIPLYVLESHEYLKLKTIVSAAIG
ncbi:AAA family ATPase [Sulfurovum sp.]|uniref:AAA family ATPase n=1 Tax=Sulfurovum sp. TaxID=1969726 RepID=UPI003561C919